MSPSIGDREQGIGCAAIMTARGTAVAVTVTVTATVGQWTGRERAEDRVEIVTVAENATVDGHLGSECRHRGSANCQRPK